MEPNRQPISRRPLPVAVAEWTPMTQNPGKDASLGADDISIPSPTRISRHRQQSSSDVPRWQSVRAGQSTTSDAWFGNAQWKEMEQPNDVDLRPMRLPAASPPSARDQFNGQGHDRTPMSSYDQGFADHYRQDPQASLLHNAAQQYGAPQGHFSTPPPYLPYGGAPPGRGPGKRPGTWRWRWDSSWNMYAFFLFGFACALGHHLFYNALDGQAADNQIQMLRYGTVLAFAAKAGLSTAVVLAFRQRAWTTVRTRFLSVAAIDSLFAAAEDLAALFNWEVFSKAKTATALAAFVWLSPLVVILTSNTLLVEPRTIVDETSCAGIRTLNFSFEETTDWRQPQKIDGLFQIPISYWNTTKPENEDPPGWFDYYTGPSPPFAQTATLSAFLNEVVGRKNSSVDTCASGWNCTFEIRFTAPGYKCKEVASGVGSHPVNLEQESGSAKPPFNTDLLLPKGQFAYYAYTSGGEYSMMQLKEVNQGGIPKMKPPYPPHLGALRTEPILWIGYAVSAIKEGESQPDNPSDPKWASAWIPKIFACEHYETAYHAHFNYTDGTQTAHVRNRTFLAPIINTTFVPGKEANDGTADNTTATPESNYVLPTDVARYRKTAAYHSLGQMLRVSINGTVKVEKSLVNPIADTGAIQTKLLNLRNNYFPYPNLMDLVQGMYEDMILSMLSNPQFVEVVWAAKPDEQSGTLRDGPVGADLKQYAYPCTRTRTANMYSYHARDLWIVYAFAVGLSVLSIAAGALALHENGGVTRNTRFSSVVAATRGSAAEKINWEGPGIGQGEVPRDVKSLRLGYGVINDGVSSAFSRDAGYPAEDPTWKPGEIRYGFGLEGDVKQIRSEGSLFRK